MSASPNITPLSPIVDLEYAHYKGTALSSGVSQYLGMRYAAAPLGDLRFRAPVPPPVMPGVQDATVFKPICLSAGANYSSPNESDDCLFINVWSPSAATQASTLPVWVYIQGGGYQANSNANYNGSGVVSASGQSIVFVNLNYRVGCWGFLAGEEVRKNGDLNVGLLDQRLALEWVQKHISKFGGNPDHVVVHGVSAGAGSVALHLTAYGGRNDNLFVGAILESPFLPTHPPVSELEWQFQDFVKGTNCDGAGDIMSALRSIPAPEVQAANLPTPYPGRQASPRFPWTPVIDGDLIRNYPYRMFEQGNFIKVPVLIGNDTDEGSGFAPNAASPADVSEFFLDNFSKLSPEDTKLILDHYPLKSPLPLHEPYFPSASGAYGDSTFTSPGITFSTIIAAHFSPHQVWNYRYNVQDQRLIDLGLGVPHTFETPAIFGVDNTGDGVESSYRTYNSDIVPIVMNYWISFIRNLDPNIHKHKDAPIWESWGSEGGKRLVLETNKSRMEDVPTAEVARAVFWTDLGDAMRH